MLNKLTKFKQTEIGPIPEEWDVKVLGDLLSFEYGKALKESGRSGDNFPVYGSNGVVGFHDEFLVKGPGIVVGRKGSAGEVIFANQDFYPIDTTYFVKTKEDLKYIFYLLKTLDLKSLVSSSAVPGLNRNDAYSLPITIPNSENEQTQIAEILSSLDDKIELNREMNKTLEEFGQAIFKRWFVGFEFPNSQGLPYKSSGGEMIKSELGEIPKEWSAGVLSEIVNNVNDRYNGDNLVDKFQKH
jgi:type I restriction enzyme S subunit